MVDGNACEGMIDGSSAVINGREHPLGDLRFLPPSCPGKIVCVGLNYLDHAHELGMEIPNEPVLFLKPPSALNHHNGRIVLPRQSSRVEYEAELGLIIGKKCRNAVSEDAASYIRGLTCFNDVTARDLQQRDGQWTRAKGFDSFAPTGPWITTIDEFRDLDGLSLDISLEKNCKTLQDSNTSLQIFGIPYLIEFISSVMTLEAGDIISTGTPPGVGRLEAGDVVDVTIEGVGTLRNSVERAEHY